MKQKNNCSRKTDRYGLRVGIDLFKLRLYDEGYKGIEFVGDYRLTKNIFWLLNKMKTKPLMMNSILQQNRI
jgi:hypothetical protein